MAFPPDFNFELLLRRWLVDELQAFDETTKEVNEDPRFRNFLIQYNSYQQYLRDVAPLPDSMPFVGLLVGIELLLKQKLILNQLGDKPNTLPVAIGLIKQLLERVDKPIKEILSQELEVLLKKLEDYEKELKDLYSSDLKEGLEGLAGSNRRVEDLHTRL